MYAAFYMAVFCVIQVKMPIVHCIISWDVIYFRGILWYKIPWRENVFTLFDTE